MQPFQQRQKQLSDYIRDPEGAELPAGIEPRRLEIYRDLFFNNFDGFISSAFPVCRSLFDDASWRGVLRVFMQEHRCESPYFLNVAEEFLQFADTAAERLSLPAFFGELAHYEWVELALDTAGVDIPMAQSASAVDSIDALLAHPLRMSPLAWSLAYRFPVHRIGHAFQPTAMPAEPTFLIVYRKRDDQVGFMEINRLTAQLLEYLDQDQSHTARTRLTEFAEKLDQPVERIVGFAGELLFDMWCSDIVIIPECDSAGAGRDCP